MKQKIKEILTVENILCLFIIICPVLDMASFIFRNYFKTTISPSTFIRPIIPIIIITYIFFKDKIKFKLILAFVLYAIYGIMHLALYSTIQNGSSYAGITHEAQYIINYSFMILNLFIYLYIFWRKDTNKLKKGMLISNTIYIVSMFISILTKTSSSTYVEGMGYKGWFESGNSISSILILQLFIILNLVKDKKCKYWVIAVTALVGIYLTTLIGTRVGLFGFILVLFIYASIEIFTAMIRKVQLNKNVLIGSICAIVLVLIVIAVVGSNTLQRRKHLKDIESNIIDKSTNEEAHISGSLLEIKEKIDNNELEEGYMSEAEKKSILELYEYANKYGVVNNDMRTQQLIYNSCLVKNQANPLLILFGNGYLNNYRELVFEMEFLAFLFNFGLCGFTLYMLPFISIFIYAIYKVLKNMKQLDSEYLMLLAGAAFSFVFSLLSGYTFFNSSSMMVIIVINVLLLNKVYNFKKIQ